MTINLKPPNVDQVLSGIELRLWDQFSVSVEGCRGGFVLADMSVAGRPVYTGRDGVRTALKRGVRPFKSKEAAIMFGVTRFRAVPRESRLAEVDPGLEKKLCKVKSAYFKALKQWRRKGRVRRLF